MKFAIFDTETTGLLGNSLKKDKAQPSLIEFAGVHFEDGEVVFEMDFLCSVAFPLDPKIIKITKIDDAMLKSEPPFDAYVEAITSFFEECDGMIAHNLYFDRTILEIAFRKIGKPPITFPKRQICTVEATEYLKGYRLKLLDLHEELTGEPFTEAHRAMKDVQALTRCVSVMLQRNMI